MGATKRTNHKSLIAFGVSDRSRFRIVDSVRRTRPPSALAPDTQLHQVSATAEVAGRIKTHRVAGLASGNSAACAAITPLQTLLDLDWFRIHV